MHKLAIVVTPPTKYDAYCIPKPDGFEFQDDTHSKEGEYITVKVKADGDDKLKVVEVEGLPTTGEDDEDSEVTDTDEDGE
jgi:hypothetical protein